MFFHHRFPQETREDLEQTFSMALRLKRLGVDDFWFSCAMPYLGTKLFEMCCEFWLHFDWNSRVMEISTRFGIIDSRDFNSLKIQLLRDNAMRLLNAKGEDHVQNMEDIFKIEPSAIPIS